MFGIKKKTTKIDIKTLINDTALALDEAMAESEGTDELLARLGLSRKQVLDAALADDEVESCREDLRVAMQSASYRLWGESVAEEDINRLLKMIKKQLPTLVDVVLSAKFVGYSVAEYVYQQEDDGFLSIAKIIDKSGEIDSYSPRRGGDLIFKSQNGEVAVDLNVKHLLLTNQANSANPAGEAAVARIYPALALRKHGLKYAAQFVRRYAQPYLVGKIGGLGSDPQGFVERVSKLFFGGSTAISSEDDIQLLTNPADGSAFRMIEQLANARIQKALLGRVKTGDLEHGSRAAQETEEETRNDRIDGYLLLLANAMQHLIDALLKVNQAYGKAIHAPEGLWFEFDEGIQIDLNRAKRDQIYLASGQVRFTLDYYQDILGFEERHIELINATTQNTLSEAQLADKNANRLPENTETAILRPKIKAILDALQNSTSYMDFEEKLAHLDLSDEDAELMNRLLGDATQAFVDGIE